MQIIYKKIPPPSPLRNYVRYFWILEDHSPDPSKTFKIIADGCPGFFFNQTADSVIYQNNEKLLPPMILYGQATKYAELNLSGNPNIMGACFHPNALRLIFNLDADELTDSCIDLNLIEDKQKFHLPEKLNETASSENQIEIVSSYLLEHIRHNNFSQDITIQNALAQIIQSNGNLTLSELQKSLGLSERSLERKFKQNVGIPPKLFSRIWRFQSSLEQLQNNDSLKLSEIAYDNEYADQSHFIRAFREFAGFPPNQLKKQYHEVRDNFFNVKI